MTALFYLVFTTQIFSSLLMISLVLLQQGKGAEFGASAGSNAPAFASSTGSSNFLVRATQWVAAVFFASTLALSYLSANAPLESNSVLTAPEVALTTSTNNVASPVVQGTPNVAK